GTVCVVGKMRDLILQLSKSSIYSTKPMRSTNDTIRRWYTVAKAYKRKLKRFIPAWNSGSYRGLKAMQVSNVLN
ncbi:hypothetical protein LVT04_26530, partial [Klebsiella pneumoniae]|nr:hypothetical protein [Klebsiella pneumoniae]MCD9974820.1 hypothetical protein [Klebsiella pneumoniae]